MLQSKNENEFAKWLQHRDKLTTRVNEALKQIEVVEQPCEGEQQFYEIFKYQIAHQQLSDMKQQVLLSSNIDRYRKTYSESVLTKMSQILKSYSTVQNRLQIKINQHLHILARDTLRSINDMFESCQQVDKLQFCGKEIANAQYDKYMRQLDQYGFFWENVLCLENRNIKVNKDSSFDTITKYVDNWLETLPTKSTNQSPVHTQMAAPFMTTMNTLNTQQSQKQSQTNFDNRLRQAHELYAGLAKEQDQLGALQLYTKLANEGNSTAQAIMGQILLEGLICPQDFDSAFTYFKKSGDQQNVFGLYWASRLVLEGKVCDKFIDRDDQTHYSGLSGGVAQNQDYGYALVLMKNAAELGHIQSMLYLGDLYFNGVQINGFIIERDYSMAEKYYKQAKQKNSIPALHKIGMLYQVMCKHTIFKKRIDLIIPNLTQAKNQDYLPAFFDLGQLLFKGFSDEIKPNPIMADLVFEQGAMKGDKKCAQQLLNIRFKGLKNGQIQLDEFLELLDQLEQVNKEWTMSSYMRGKIYSNGVKVERNIAKALEQYRIGMQKGCEKCKDQYDKLQKDNNFSNQTENPTNSQQSSQPQAKTLNIIEQLRAKQQKPYQKARQVSLGNVQHRSIHTNPVSPVDNQHDNQIENTSNDRKNRLTISIVSKQDHEPDPRKRVTSEAALQSLQKSILLSGLFQQDGSRPRLSQFFSPRSQTKTMQQQEPLSSIITQSKKKRYNLNKIKHSNFQPQQNPS